jgi:hypothetical protein
LSAANYNVPGGYHNQARMTIQSSGTTAFALAAAVQQFNTFANAGVIDQEVLPYGAIDTSTNNSEKGWGLYSTSGSSTGGPSLTRNVFQSTNSNNLVAFSSSATQVFIDPSVADLVQLSLMAHANLGGL